MAIDLGKVTLDKSNDGVVKLERSNDHGLITVNLNWNINKLSKGIDLDLSCLYKLKNGKTMGIQALGSNFGSFYQEPFIELEGDDTTGNNAGGENLRINGAKWNQIDKILIYAMIYKGVKNWSDVNGVVTIDIPEYPTLEILLDNPQNGLNHCGVCLLKNVNNGIELTKVEKYYQGAKPMDREFGFGLNWGAGRK